MIVIPIAEVDTEEGRQHLTAKTMHAFKYVYDHHYDDADWFMKVRNCLDNVQSQYHVSLELDFWLYSNHIITDYTGFSNYTTKEYFE